MVLLKTSLSGPVASESRANSQVPASDNSFSVARESDPYSEPVEIPGETMNRIDKKRSAFINPDAGEQFSFISITFTEQTIIFYLTLVQLLR